MVTDDELACMRAAVEEDFQDEAQFPSEVRTADGRGGYTIEEGDGTTTPATLSRMSSGEERNVASKLEGRSGYRLKVPHTFDPDQRGDVVVNGDRYEIIAGFGNEARSSHTKFHLARYS